MNLWDKQKEYLQQTVKANQESVKRRAQKSLGVIERNSPASQEDALRNGEPQEMLIVRMKTKEIKITAFMGDELNTGDIIDCFGEKWLVMESFTNETGIRYGSAWACNTILRFQNGTSEVIERHAIIDDGNYINVARFNPQLPLEEGFYKVYLPLDDDTQKIHINKRFSIGIAYNERVEPILAVIRTVWIDPKSRNIGLGSQLLSLRMERDVFNAQKDNVEKMICDYILGNDEQVVTPPDPDPDNPVLHCMIVGRDTIRIGTTRVYAVQVIDENAEVIDTTGTAFVWTFNTIQGIEITTNGGQLSIQVPLNFSLIGQQIELSVVDANEEFVEGTLKVEVVD